MVSKSPIAGTAPAGATATSHDPKTPDAERVDDAHRLLRWLGSVELIAIALPDPAAGKLFGAAVR